MLATCLIGLPGGAVIGSVAAEELLDDQGSGGDRFGWAVAIDGDLLMVGAPFDDTLDDASLALDRGSITAFSNSVAGWQKLQKVEFTTSDLALESRRWWAGYSIALQGTRAVVGAPLFPDSDTAKEQGAAVEFTWEGANISNVKWNYGFYSTESFGRSVATDSKVIVGAPWAGPYCDDFFPSCDPGVEFIYLLGRASVIGDDWLLPPEPIEQLEFGGDVAIEGDVVAVGAQGTVFVFEFDGNVWHLIQELTTSGPYDLDGTEGYMSVDLDGGTLVVGDRSAASAGGTASGGAHVYIWNGSAFEAPQDLWPSDGGPGDQFGRDIAIDGDTIVVGAPFHDGPGIDAGAAYVYVKNGTAWEYAETLTSPDAGAGDQFGFSVAVDGIHALIGAPYDDNEHGDDAGIAYVFDLGAGPPTSSTIPTTTTPSTTLPTTVPPTAPALQDVGLVDPASGRWDLLQSGNVTSFFFGNPGDYPIVGDWDCDGIETPGLYRQTDGFVYLRNSNTQGIADIRFFFGNPSDIPLAGDFNGDGCDTVSIFRPSEGHVFIMNKLGANEGGLGTAEYDYFFGNPGDKPFVGDFDGDGIETIGLHRESTGFVYFRQSHTQGVADTEYFFGDPGDRLIAGDWGIIDGVDTVAIFRPSDATFYFRYTNTQGNADHQISWGNPTGLPIAGEMGLK